MQRLNYCRTISVPVSPHLREAIIDFYRAEPRSWTCEPDRSSVFEVNLSRGNWAESRFPSWLRKSSLAGLFGRRRPRPPSFDGVQLAIDTWPAKLMVKMTTSELYFNVSLSYEVSVVGSKEGMSRNDRTKWKAAVERDALELAEYLMERPQRS